jgi:hypothetical protein
MSRRISVRVPARSASCTIESPEAETEIGIVDQQGDNGFRPRGKELTRNITACAVKAGACGMDIGMMTVGPIDEIRHRLQQGLTQRGQTIFDARRLGWKDMAGDQSVAFQIAQGLGEHSLGDAADGAAKLAEALRSRREGHDHEYAPFVADAVEHVAHRAVDGIF